jgi:hypothetical protein
MNLKEARKLGKLKQFAKEHEIKPADRHPMGRERFDALMDAMTKGLAGHPPSASKAAGTKASSGTSRQAPSAGSSGTRTRRGT